jgi:hypothetical protein
MTNYWIVGAWNIRHAIRNGIVGEWAITILPRLSSINQGDKAVIYVLKESRHNPSGKGAACFIGDFTVDSGPLRILGPWIWADHTYEGKTAESQGFKLKDFRLWDTFVEKNEARQHGADFKLGRLRAGQGLMQIDREAYLRIIDAYANKAESGRG